MDPYIEMFEWEDFHVTFMVKFTEEFHRLAPDKVVARLRRRDIGWENLAVREFDRREVTFVEILEAPSRRLITAVELLWPTCKDPVAEAGQIYEADRQRILHSCSHLVEIDLLRGGQRISFPECRFPPDCDYHVAISRAERRPNVKLIAWRLPQRTPVIPVPLTPEFEDVRIDLQPLVNLVYRSAGYELTIDYSQPLVPPARAEDFAWLKSVLQSPISMN